MNVFVNILLVLDGFVFIMVVLDSISKKEPKQIYNHQTKVLDIVTENTMEKIETEKNKSSRLGMIIGTMLAIVIFFAFATSIITIPTYLWIRYDFSHALLGYVLINFFFSIYLLKIKIRKLGIENLRESQPVFVVITNLFRILLLIVVYFGWKANFQESMIKIYENFNVFNYLFVVLYPVLIIGIVITNIYALLNGMLLFSKNQPMNKEWRTSLKDILLIFVISSFIGIIYLSDNNLTFVSQSDMEFIAKNIEIVKIFLTAIFIPLLFDKIVSIQKEGKKVTDNVNIDKLSNKRIIKKTSKKSNRRITRRK
jgi:hypothetical protein